MRIINYGHACFKIIDDGISVVLDPYQNGSVPGLEMSKDIEANYVFSSHDHFDHNAVDLIKHIPTDKPLNMVEVLLPHDNVGGAKRGMSIARIFKFSDYTICHMGDIGDAKAVLKHEELKNIDIVLCPINGFFTISAKEAYKLQKEMGWKVLIPMHYYDKKKQSGYPDGDQITAFKDYYQKDDTLLVGDYLIDVNETYMSFKTLIFLENK